MIFGLVILLCDGLLRNQGEQDSAGTEEDKAKEESSRRFFKIAMRLHLDLQHVLCNRAVGKMADLICKYERDLAFEKLLKQVN